MRWTKQAVHLICMASVYYYSMLFLATSCLLYADTVPLEARDHHSTSTPILGISRGRKLVRNSRLVTEECIKT